jgi:hypothetical protein
VILSSFRLTTPQVRAAEERAAAAAAAQLVAERVERAKALDGVREQVCGGGACLLITNAETNQTDQATNQTNPPNPCQVNVLAAALARRGEEAAASAGAHRSALGALALARALDEGRPAGRELRVRGREGGCGV